MFNSKVFNLFLNVFSLMGPCV